MTNWSQIRLQKLADTMVLKSADPKRRKCFVSYHHADEDAVAEFLEEFGTGFIPRILGISDDDDDLIESDDTDYVMDQIRERYLTDSTVTIVMVGKCTWARRYIDWEIYSSLRNDKNNRRSGLMAITLPSMSHDTSRQTPPRVSDNLLGKDSAEGYARWWKYPTSLSGLQSCIETAFGYRTTRAELIDNTRARKKKSSQC